ncbi:MAG: alpha/beta hydrolase, partial [Treponema sp.]|nr:alpha/beta hydrolase [Treponema sp.]
MKGTKKKVASKILMLIFLALLIFLTVQGVRCALAVKKARANLLSYGTRTADLSYGKMSYVDKGSGESVILSVHGIFGGYDQGFETCRDFSSDYRIISPSRFGYLGSDVSGNGTPSEQAAAYCELLDKLQIQKVFVLATSAGGSVAIRFALDFPERCKGLILYCSGMP